MHVYNKLKNLCVLVKALETAASEIAGINLEQPGELTFEYFDRCVAAVGRLTDNDYLIDVAVFNSAIYLNEYFFKSQLIFGGFDINVNQTAKEIIRELVA